MSNQNTHIFSSHQKEQVKVIDEIERQVQTNSLAFTIVPPTENYDTDDRMALTSVHFPSHELIQSITEKIIRPLHEIAPEHYYYAPDSLHMTIKNIKVINNPPHFSENDVATAKSIFATTIPQHKKFQVYFYRLLLFPVNLALIGTTDSELDDIALKLDQKLKEYNVPDEKIYTNSKYFFSNMTLLRFQGEITQEFKNKVQELSHSLMFPAYTVDFVSLITSNAVMKKRTIVGEWKLQ